MKDDKVNKWVNAAKILRKDPSSKVACPNCGHKYLQVKDVLVDNVKKCDRYIFCDNCKASNVITFSTA